MDQGRKIGARNGETMGGKKDLNQAVIYVKYQFDAVTYEVAVSLFGGYDLHRSRV